MANCGRAVWVATATMIKCRRDDWEQLYNRAISKGAKTVSSTLMGQWEIVAYRMADIFAADSPGFNRETFLTNCGLSPRN